MFANSIVEVHDGNTLQTIQDFLRGLLELGVVDRLFAPVDIAEAQEARPRMISGAAEIGAINPLLPLMLENAARGLSAAMKDNPEMVFGAVLRSCEARAVIEMARQGRIERDRLILIGVDCLATYDPDFYHALYESHPDDPYWLMRESLRFSRMGQIAPFRYRAACRICEDPTPSHSDVDITLGLIGIDARQSILVIAQKAVHQRLKLHKLTDRLAADREVIHREGIVWKLSRSRREFAQRELERLSFLDDAHAQIHTYMAQCTQCGECIKACPLCCDEFAAALQAGTEAFTNTYIYHAPRLACCAACGMCQLNCPEQIPLSLINYMLSRQVRAGLGYTPGSGRHDQMAVAS